MTDEPTIVYTDYGIANRHENIIYINRNLLRPEWEELYQHAIRHETTHSPGDRYRAMGRDFLLDLYVPFKLWLMSLKFMSIYPRALMQLSPIRYLKGDGEKDGLLAFDMFSIVCTVVIVLVIWYLIRLIGGF